MESSPFTLVIDADILVDQPYKAKESLHKVMSLCKKVLINVPSGSAKDEI